MSRGTAALRASLVASLASLIRDSYRVLGAGLVLLFALTLASAVLEGLTIAMLLPLLAALGFGGSGSDQVTAIVLAVTRATGLTFTPTSVAVLLLVLLAVSAAVFLAQAYFATRLQARYVAHWQRQVCETALAANWPFLRRQRMGEVVGAMTTEAARLGAAFYYANLMVVSVCFLLAQTMVAALVAPSVTAAILLLSVVLFAVTQQLVRRAMELGSATTQANIDLQSTTGEIAGALKLIKATAHETDAGNALMRDIGRIEFLSFRHAFDVQIVRAVFEYSSGAAVALLLLAGPLWLGVEIGVVLVVVAMFVRLFPKVTGLRQCLQSIGLVLPAFETLRSMTDRAAAAREQPSAQAVTRRDAGAVAIRFDRVSLRGDADEVVLDGVDLDIPAGSFVALVGSTGAGKTTLADCALGLAIPSSGQVLIDGAPLQTMSLQAWRHDVGYLGQDPVLFAGTVRDNVTWGRPFDDAAVVAGLEMAGAGFVLRLPAGLDTPVLERGGSLSGGERQRIALARALAGTPRLLVLDEATSALDAGTESAVAEVLSRQRGRVTILAISHRFALVREADVIVVLEAGRIAERGTFGDLLARGGRFAALWRTQNENSTARSDGTLADAVP